MYCRLAYLLKKPFPDTSQAGKRLFAFAPSLDYTGDTRSSALEEVLGEEVLERLEELPVPLE